MIIHNRFLKVFYLPTILFLVTACASHTTNNKNISHTSLSHTQANLASVTQATFSTPPTGLAQCLREKNVKFYGAYWCKHCLEQKKLFASEKTNLPYIECSLPEKQGQTSECIEAKITSYPTWEFADGKRKLGILDYAYLAKRSGCTEYSPL